MSAKHSCPICKTKHTAPAAKNVMFTYARALMFTAIEVLAALALDGWLAAAVWAIAAWNVLLLTMLTFGLAQIAAGERP